MKKLNRDLVNQPNHSVANSIAQRKPNNTGLPDNLKSGIENLSGHSLDDVKVHYNSPRPAQLQAHAFAQGNQIHLSPGQEKHLPHEAWHVVQQKQGRVKPTMQMKSAVPINDDPGLEKEADVMGVRAQANSFGPSHRRLTSVSSMGPIQMMPQNRNEYDYTVKYFHNGREPLPEHVLNFLGLLHDYKRSDIKMPATKKLIFKINEDLKKEELLKELKDLCMKIDPEHGATRWQFILQHLKSGTADEIKEYHSFASRWFGSDGRVVKYGAIGTTLGVQSITQAVMGNQVSSAAFGMRGLIHEVKLYVQHGISLHHKIEHPGAFRMLTQGLSLLFETAKFFETWTPKGIISDKDKVRMVSNVIKKIRAALMFLKEAIHTIHPINLAPIDRYFNSVTGVIETIINFASLSDEHLTADVIGNIAKLLRHVLGGAWDFVKTIYASIRDYLSAPAQPVGADPAMAMDHVI
ncbi:DUF4157 domain-containing protein [Marinoscillum sp.]|uniref:eCIS core domain-containing protein n=1 Tax=Marinoscillum sp. TaxID=2024838 RepID=UPI003BAB7507